MISDPIARISRWITPTALVSASSDRKELEQSSSARRPVRCASVRRSGRISWRTTVAPAWAICQAASEPARPPPITWMGVIARLFCAGRSHSQWVSLAQKEKRPPGEDRRALERGLLETTGRGIVSARPRNFYRSGGDVATDDELDVAAANADIAEFTIAQPRQLLDGFAIAAPGVELLGNGLDRGHDFAPWLGLCSCLGPSGRAPIARLTQCNIIFSTRFSSTFVGLPAMLLMQCTIHKILSNLPVWRKDHRKVGIICSSG